MKLTDAICRNTKPSDRYQDISDAGTPLTLRVKANGERLFIWRGRVGGKQTMRTIGAYPDMTLADARLKAMEMKRDAKASVATIAPVVHPHHRPKCVTVSVAIGQYEKGHLDDLATGSEVRSQFDRRLVPAFGDRDIKSLTRIELNQHFNELRDEGFNGAGLNRYLANVKAFLNWSVREDLIEFNPAQTIQKKVKEKPRDRLLRDWELAAAQHALTECGPYATPLALLLMTCTRRSDIIALTWGEVVTLDDGSTEFNIEKTKSGVRHLVPLPPKAAALLPKRPDDASDKDRVFPDACLAAGRPLLEKVRRLTTERAGKDVDHFTFHDFRTACTTWLSDQRARKKIMFSDQAKDILLAHVPTGVTRKHYDFSACLEERADMLNLWVDHLLASAKRYPPKHKEK